MNPDGFSNSLADLAARINGAHAEVLASLRTTLTKAMAVGDLLIEAKGQVPHGQWLPWLAERCPALSDRTARHYMRLARNREALAKSANFADLTAQEAAQLLAAPEPVPVLWLFLRDLLDIHPDIRLTPKSMHLPDDLAREQWLAIMDLFAKYFPTEMNRESSEALRGGRRCAHDGRSSAARRNGRGSGRWPRLCDEPAIGRRRAALSRRAVGRHSDPGERRRSRSDGDRARPAVPGVVVRRRAGDRLAPGDGALRGRQPAADRDGRGCRRADLRHFLAGLDRPEGKSRRRLGRSRAGDRLDERSQLVIGDQPMPRHYSDEERAAIMREARANIAMVDDMRDEFLDPHALENILPFAPRPPKPEPEPPPRMYTDAQVSALIERAASDLRTALTEQREEILEWVEGLLIEISRDRMDDTERLDEEVIS